MVRTAFWYMFFWAYMIVTAFLYIPFLFMRIFKQKGIESKYILFLSRTWGRNLIRAAGGKVTVTGLEHIPRQNNICLIANHQGGFDIPLIFGYIPKTVGFIAKKELRYVPIMGTWMKAIHCIFINRSNRRESVKVIQQGVEQIKQGFQMVIFPEGTSTAYRLKFRV